MERAGVPTPNIPASEAAAERRMDVEEVGDGAWQEPVPAVVSARQWDAAWARAGGWASGTERPDTGTGPPFREGPAVFTVRVKRARAGRSRQALGEIASMIAVPVKDREADPQIDERFGRCPFFCLIDGEGKQTFLENEAPSSPSGAGVKAVQTLADEDVTVVLSPEVGPKAMAAMEPLGIRVFHIGEARTVSEVLSSYKENKLEERKSPSTGGGLRRA